MKRGRPTWVQPEVESTMWSLDEVRRALGDQLCSLSENTSESHEWQNFESNCTHSGQPSKANCSSLSANIKPLCIPPQMQTMELKGQATHTSGVDRGLWLSSSPEESVHSYAVPVLSGASATQRSNTTGFLRNIFQGISRRITFMDIDSSHELQEEELSHNPKDPLCGYNMNVPTNLGQQFTVTTHKCSVGFKLLFFSNIILTVLFVAIACILPLETTSRNTLSAGMDTWTSATTQVTIKSMTSNLMQLADAVNGVARSLQINETKQLRRWDAMNMPVVMQQLCNYFNASGHRTNIMYLHLSSPTSGFGAFCSLQYDNHTLVGKYVINNESDYRYVIDPETLLYAEPRQPFYPVRQMTEHEFTVEYGLTHIPYHNVAVKWWQSLQAGDRPVDSRWWVFSCFNQKIVTFTYPFLDINNNLAMITGALKPEALKTALFNPKGFSAVGKSMLIELDSQFVVSSSWMHIPPNLQESLHCKANSNYNPADITGSAWDWWEYSGCEEYNKESFVYNTTEHLDFVWDEHMRAAVDKLGGAEGISMRIQSDNQWQTSFNYNGSSFTVHVNRIDLSQNQLHMAVVDLLPGPEFDGYLAQMRITEIKSIVISLLVILVIDTLLIYIFLRPLQGIAEGLSLLTQLRDASGVIKRISVISEVSMMQYHFTILNDKLMNLKRFLPHGVMETPDDPRNWTVKDFLYPDACAPEPPHDISIPLPNDLNRTVAVNKKSGDLKRFSYEQPDGPELHLRESVLHDEINRFRRKYCSIVYVTMLIQEDDYCIDSLVEDFMEAVIPLALRLGGVVEAHRPDSIIVSFGAHSMMMMNHIRAVSFASEIMRRASKNIVNRIGAFVDLGEYFVGTCGASNRNAHVTYSMRIPLHRELLGLIFSLKCRILLTGSLATTLEEGFLTVPVDAVFCGFVNKPLILYELRGKIVELDPRTIGEARKTIRVIRHAFASMLHGDYTNAMSLLSNIAGKDIQGDRLLKLCRHFHRRGSTKPYIRNTAKLYTSCEEGVSSPNIRSFSRSSTSEEGAYDVSDSKVPILLKNNSVGEKKNSTSQLPFESLMRRHESFDSAKGENIGDYNTYKQGLFEMFLESSDDDNDGCHSVTTPRENYTPREYLKGDVPCVFTDDRGNTWTRSADCLGKGAFSVIYRGLSSVGDLVALKCLALRARNVDVQSVVEELNLFSQLHHQNIVQYISCYISTNYLIEVMELVPGGSLYDILNSFGSLSTMAVRCFLRDTLNGLVYLHSKNIVHCDVKPHNVLVAMDGVCKLGDFGSSLMRLTNSLHEIEDVVDIRGTPCYMAPEVARGEVPTAKSDVYSIGITVLQLVTGKIPLGFAKTNNAHHEDKREKEGDCGRLHPSPREEEAENSVTVLKASGQTSECKSNMERLLRNPAQLLSSVGKGEIVPIIPTWLDDEVRYFVAACVTPDPELRPTASDLLKDPWML